MRAFDYICYQNFHPTNRRRRTSNFPACQYSLACYVETIEAHPPWRRHHVRKMSHSGSTAGDSARYLCIHRASPFPSIHLLSALHGLSCHASRSFARWSKSHFGHRLAYSQSSRTAKKTHRSSYALEKEEIRRLVTGLKPLL